MFFLILIAIVINFIFISIPIFNYFFAPRFSYKKLSTKTQPKVAILIPCRNEQENISGLIESLIKQDYSNFILILLDDNSEDKTLENISIYQKKYNYIYGIKGKELKADWLGKNWACHQLYQEAKDWNPEFLIFLDADVRINKSALSSMIWYFGNYQLDSLSVFPSQVMKTKGEKIIIPIMNWILLTFLPLSLIRNSKAPSLSAANGQFIAFKTSSYQKINGHKSVKSKIVEDVELFRKMKEENMKVMTFLDDGLVSCRMYKDFFSAYSGFLKNLYNGSPIKGIFFIFFITLVGFYLILTPLIAIFHTYPAGILLILLFLFQRILISLSSKQSTLNLLFLPIQSFIFPVLMLHSFILSNYGEIYWKERKVN